MRPRRVLEPLPLLAALLAVGAAGPAAVVASAAPLAERAAPPGKAGSPITLANGVDLKSWDAVVGSDGTTYLGWIAAEGGSGRQVFSCRIPVGATTCDPGIQIASPGTQGGSSASGLHLLDAGGTITLVWFHDTDASVGNDRGAEISSTTVAPNGGLTAVTKMAEAPSFGGLYDAEVGPDGKLWVVTWDDSGDSMQVDRIDPGAFGPPDTTFDPAFDVGQARIAFDHDQGVLVVDQAGGFGEPVKVTSQRADGTWRAITKVPGNWSLQGDWDLARGRGETVRLVTSVPKASYFPQIAAWQGTEFGDFRLTGYKGSCQFTTHDLYADASGRLADIYNACGKVRLFNQPTAGTAAMASFSEAGTPVGGNSFASNGPQIATSPRGTGWIMWAVLDDVTGTDLRAAPVRLPALPRSARQSGSAGSVTVTGPVSCLPAVQADDGVKADPAPGWSVVSKALLLDGDAQGGTLHGESLAPGSAHTLTGVATFARDGDKRTVKAKLTFRACPAPSAF